MSDECKDLLHTIAIELRKARASAARAESDAYEELATAKIAGVCTPEYHERYEYVLGKFAGLSDAVELVDEILKRQNREA